MRAFLSTLRENNIHLRVEAGELAVKFPKGKIDPVLLGEIKSRKAELVTYLTALNRHFSIQSIEEQANYVLSSSQRRLWVLSGFEEGRSAYNMPGVYVFEGDLDLSALEQAFNVLVKRHEILRTVIKENERGEPRQFINAVEDTGFRVSRYDLRKEAGGEQRINELVRASFAQPFDLAVGPLIRANLYQVTDHKWVFSYVMHHIISDGWSMNILINELLLCYNAFIEGGAAALMPLRIQYKDYSAWQQTPLTSEALSEHRNYWLQQFEGTLPVLNLPEDKRRPAVKTYNGASITKSINETVSKGIKALCQEQGATLFMGLLAGVNALLYRYTGQDDIVIGSPIAGREHPDLEDQIGFYVNTLPLRSRFKGEHSFSALLEQVKGVALGAYEHQAYPFDELVEILQPPRDLSRNVLFDVWLVLHNAESISADTPRELNGLTVSGYDAESGVSKFDLTFNFYETGEALQVNIEYNRDIYTDRSIARLGDHLSQLLTIISTQPDIAIDNIDYLSPVEKHQLLDVFNHTDRDFPKDLTLAALFEVQAKKTPDQAAVVFEGTVLSYRVLSEKAGQLGNYLRKKYRVKANDLVGIKLERSQWMIVALLGVLKSGGAYVPIDPTYPEDRIDLILEDIKCKVLIDRYELETFIQEARLYDHEWQDTVSGPSDLAYVIYTSGSTGQPKGVLIEQHAIVNTILAQRSVFDLKGMERGLLFASFSFDASVSEMFTILTSGGTLYIIGEEARKDPLLFEQYIAEHRIDFATIPPAMQQLLPVEKLSTMKKLVSAGEAAISAYAADFAEKGDYYNAYGPTESAICATVFSIEKGDLITQQPIPIGSPIANTQLYVLDARMYLVPTGVAGEMYIGGAGLARGYLGQDALTAERFVPNPYMKGAFMYKTGDMGKWLEDGNIVYMGRNDDQIKIRGYRVEPGEIESALNTCPGVEAAVVIALAGRNGEKELQAFVVGAKELTTSGLHEHLSSSLPAYMMPDHFIQLAAFPLTVSGKIDKKKLQDTGGLEIQTGEMYVAPRNEIEEKLVQLWEEILDRKPIGIKDNFFKIGGHSLKGTLLITRIRKLFDVNLSLSVLFGNPTIEGLYSEIEKTYWVNNEVAAIENEENVTI